MLQLEVGVLFTLLAMGLMIGWSLHEIWRVDDVIDEVDSRLEQQQEESQ